MKFFLHLILFGLLFNILGGQRVSAQVNFPECTSNYYRKVYQNPGTNYMSDFVVLPGGNMICVGYAQLKFCIVKHNSAGDIISTKMIPENNGSSSLAKIKWETDSTLIVIGSGGRDVYDIDTSCNILYSKKLVDTNGNPTFCYDVESLADGDKIILHTRDISPQYVTRFSPDFSTVRWSRLVTGEEYSFESIFRNIFLDGEKLFLTGGAGENYGWNHFGTVIQLNASSGNMEKSRRFRLAFSDVDASGVFLGKMLKYNNGYIVKGRYTSSSELPVTDVMGYARLDTALNVTTIKSFQNINNTVAQSSTSYDLYAEPDGSIFGAHGSSNYNMFHINSNDTLLWTRRLDPWLGHAVAFKKTSDGFVGFGNDNYYAVGVGYFGYYYILKSTANGDIPGCQPYTDGLSLRELPFSILTNITAVIDSTNIHAENIAVSTVSGNFDKSVGCDKVSTCNSIQIIGGNTHCSTLPALFKGRRNAGCRLPFTFSATPAAGVSIQPITDSTSAISFSANGSYLIRSLLHTNCGDFYDSMVVKVQVAAPLQLGADTLLCVNSSIKLNAQQGYQTYLWNNGSADSTLSINAAGVYDVNVKDFCGNFYYDTIVVKSASAFPFTAGPDSSICNGQQVLLTATAGFINYRWYPNYKSTSTNTAAISVSPNIDTSYIVTAEKWAGCFVKDTVSIVVKQVPLINLGSDTSFCNKDSIILQVPGGFKEYSWNTGSASPSITIKTAGIYSIIANAANDCTSKDTLVVKEIYTLPKVDLGNDMNICAGTQKQLDAGVFESYFWHNQSLNRYFTADDKDTYWVKVMDNHHCTTTDTIEIKSILPSPSNFLSSIDSLCRYDKIQLQPTRNFMKYNWSNGSQEQSIVVDQPGGYMLQVTDENGCVGNDSSYIAEKDCMHGVFIPSAFTPNNDLKNDYFRAKIFGKLISFQLTIFNRAGQVVFTTTDFKKEWDGSLKGVLLDTNTFVYTCSYHLEGSKPAFEKGTILLIR